MINKPNNSVGLILLAILIVLILNSYLRWPLYIRGVNLIHAIQQYELLFLDWLFLFVTMLIDPSIVLAFSIIIIVLSRRKAKAYVLLLFILFNTYLTGVLKAKDCDPRPFWSNHQIKNIGFYCPQEYGNPSGHSWFASIIGFGFILDYYGVGKGYKHLAIALAMLFLVPLSRMYLGAHSLNQVLQGMTLGLSMNILYILCLKKYMIDYLTVFTRRKLWRYFLFILHVGYLVPYFMNIGDELPQHWIRNVKNKCGKDIDEEHLNFMMLMINSLLVNVGTGIGMGFSSLKNSKLGKHYLEGTWHINQQKYEWKLGYFLFIMIELGCLLSGLVGGLCLCVIMPSQLTIFVGMNLGALGSGYIYTSKTIELLAKYRVITYK